MDQAIYYEYVTKAVQNLLLCRGMVVPIPGGGISTGDLSGWVLYPKHGSELGTYLESFVLSQQVLKCALPSDGPQAGDTQESRSGEAPVTTEQSKQRAGPFRPVQHPCYHCLS